MYLVTKVLSERASPIIIGKYETLDIAVKAAIKHGAKGKIEQRSAIPYLWCFTESNDIGYWIEME